MLPLNTGWRIFADDLPARLTESENDTAFHLPGADALADFSDLLGESACPDSSETVQTDAPFPLPAALPEDVRGAAELRLNLDFGKLHAQDAELVFELIRGKGRVFIGDTPAASFQNPKDGMLRVPLFRALHLGRRQTVRLCFDASRPAGVLGGVCLHAVSHARLRDTVLIPDAQTQTVRLQTTVCAMNTGDYLLRVQTACAENEPPVYDDALFLSSGEQQPVTKTFPFPAPRFLPGSPYAGCAVRLTLFKRRLHRGTFFPGSRCDEQTVSCGYSGRPADYDLPLLSEECADPNALLARLSPMRLPGLRLDAPAPDLFYRKMTLSGIGVFHPVATDALRERLSRHACVSFGDAPMPRMRSLPLLDAWQLCGLTACLRTPPADMSPSWKPRASRSIRKVRMSPPFCCGFAPSAFGSARKRRGRGVFRVRSVRPASGRMKTFMPPCRPRSRRRISVPFRFAARGLPVPVSARRFVPSSSLKKAQTI